MSDHREPPEEQEPPTGGRGAGPPWPPVGGGEMAERCRALDWGATPLGPVERWPAALCAVVRTCLESPFPTNIWCGPELALIYNDGYRRVLGAKHPNALGQRGTEVWAEIWDDIGPMFGSIRAGGPPVYAEDSPFIVERADEREDAWFTFSLSPVRDDSGNIIAFLNIVAETTDRIHAEQEAAAARRAAERAEARLREVFVQAPTFLAVLRGPDHVFEFVNDAYLQLVGHRDIVGRPLADGLPEIVEQGFVGLLDRVMATGEPYVGREVAVLLARSPGAQPEQRSVDFVYQPFVDSATGRPAGIVAHGYDVTGQVRARHEVERLLHESEEARRALEEANAQLEQQQMELELTAQQLQENAVELEAQTEALEEANRAKSDFLATMSHELRTPLNAIAGYADLLLLGVRGDLTPAQRADVERMRRSGHHLLALINDVLNFAKLEAGQVEFRIEEMSLQSILDGVEDLIRPQMKAKSLHYRRDGCDADLRVSVDTEKVRQVLLNLLANAVKFTDQGGSVTISCAADDGGVRVDVADTGRGIEEGQLQRIFDPFVQVDRHLTPDSQQGVGLGLAISRDLAAAMGGTLTARSTVGRGSTFSLVLPRTR